jgi:hypothetical protein
LFRCESDHAAATGQRRRANRVGCIAGNEVGAVPLYADAVASYRTYPEAERAVALLAERMLPVEGVSIVAADLKFVEQVTGRRGFAAAAFDGVGVGAVTGAIIGLVLGIMTPVAPAVAGMALTLWGLAVGAVIGVVIGLLGHALGGQRDFFSVRSLNAGRFDVLAPPEITAEARRLLAETSRRVA